MPRTGAHRPHRLRLRIAAVAFALIAMLITMVEVRLLVDVVDTEIVGDFYTVPSPVPAGAPGDIIRIEALPGAPVDALAWRVMYHSTDLYGDDLVVSGVVIAPAGPVPAGGRPVLSWGHPTTGTAPECAPSRFYDPFLSVEGLRVMLDRGYVIAYTDYAGMGVEGPNSYLIGLTAAHTVLDAARVATAIPQAGANTDLLLWGHSQGGQAVLFAAQEAATYAPEFDLRAVAVAAPAADLGALLDAHLDDVSGVTIGSYAFQAFSEIYDEPLDTILEPAAIQVLPEMNSLCLLTQMEELHRIAGPLIGSFMISDPATTEPWADLLQQNSAGGSAFDAPLFVAQGLRDALVVPSATEAFAAGEQALGIDVTHVEVSWADHGSIAYAALPALSDWLDQVLRD
jgi:hypothetical protein